MTVVNTVVEGFSTTTTTSDVIQSITKRSLQGLSLSNITDAFTLAKQTQFITPQLTETFSRTPLRFGYSSDISALFGTEKQQRDDYLYGLAVLAAFALGLYTLWLIVILILCCLGSKRVGFLSGQPFQRRYYYVNTGQNVNYNNNGDNVVNESYKSNPYEVSTIPEDQFIDENNVQRKTMTSSGDNRSDDDDDDVYIEGDSYDNGATIQQPPKQQQQQQQSYYSTPPPQQDSTIPPVGSAYQMTKTGGGVYCCKIEQQNLIRGIYVVSGLIFITFAILSVTQGLTSLQGSIDTLTESARRIGNTTSQGEVIVSNLLSIRERTATLRTSLIDNLQLDNFCPTAPDLTDNPVAAQIISGVTTAVSGLGELQGYLDAGSLPALQASLQSLTRNAATAANTTEDIDLTSWQSLVILIPFTIIPAILIAKAIMAGYGASNSKLNCFIVWIIHPLFVLFVLLAAIGCATAVSIASANSDFCYPEQYDTNRTSVVAINTKFAGNSTMLINPPDVSVLKSIQKGGYKADSDTYKVVSFYVLQCLEVFPYMDLLDYLPTLEIVETTLSEIEAQLQNTNTETVLGAVCSRDFKPLVNDLGEMVKVLADGYKAILDTVDLIRCSNIVPIYQDTFYSASCVYSITAVTWFFASAVVMATFGFLMLMFRASILDTQYVYTYDTSYGRSSAFHDENDDETFDGQTRAGNTTAGNDTVMKSLVNYEKNHLNN